MHSTHESIMSFFKELAHPLRAPFKHPTILSWPRQYFSTVRLISCNPLPKLHHPVRYQVLYCNIFLIQGIVTRRMSSTRWRSFTISNRWMPCRCRSQEHLLPNLCAYDHQSCGPRASALLHRKWTWVFAWALWNNTFCELKTSVEENIEKT